METIENQELELWPKLFFPFDEIISIDEERPLNKSNILDDIPKISLQEPG